MVAEGQAQLTRRGALTLIAISAAGGVMMPRHLFAQSASADTAPLLLGADVCVITPEVTEGPFYFDPQLVRADIREGHPGVPVTVRLQVVDASCRPLSGARVDIWHCDASGVYSSNSGQAGSSQDPTSTTSQTFCRGTQFADDKGIVNFQSIYPGWYRGRTTHIHFKVFVDEANVLTGQIFFPDALSEFIYRNVSPYSDRKVERDTLNQGDWIARQASHASFASVKEQDNNYLVSLIVGVDPQATSSRSGGGAGNPPPDGGPPGEGGMPPGGPGDPLEGPMPEGERRGSLVPGMG